MHTVHELLRCAGLFVGDVHCRAARSGFGEAEVADSFTVILPRSGVFVGELRGRMVVCDPNHAVLLDRHERYRVRHPTDGGDRCTVLCAGEVLLRDVLGEHGARAAERAGIAFANSLAPTDAATDGLHTWLVEYLSRERADGGEAEEAALSLLAAVIAAGHRPGDRVPASRRRNELVEEAKEILARRMTEAVRLDDLAAELECSPYHLSRIFRKRTGVSLHRYHNRLRVREARERIARGERSLSALAAELGFADQAHLCRVFRRETGRTPSSFRPASCRPA